MTMHERSLRVLEFNKIKERIKEYTKTHAGAEIVEALVPYDNIIEVERNLKETDEALQLLIRKSAPPFEGVYDIREAVSRASKGSSLQAGQLLKIANVIRCARNFKVYVKNEHSEEQGYLEQLCEGIIPLKNIEDKIYEAIIGEDEISDRASTKLFSIRKELKGKSSSIKDKVGSLVRTYGDYLQENLYTVRGDRYVIPVKAEHKGAVKGLVHDVSSTGSTLFIEPIGLVNLNNEIKELKLKEKAEIERILSELSEMIYNNAEAVKHNCDTVWQLDFIFAKAKYGSHLNASMPTVNENGIVDIIQGRHPLISQDIVIANDIYLGKDFNSLVVTGPNTGGKTVTLKTLGLIELMGLSGLLIPAKDGSTISFFENIYADIGDEQSIEQSLSTFSSHMKNIVEIMDKADDRALVLFDELGAGTDPTEGAGLAIAILEDLRKRKTRIAATTHYSELKGYALKTIGVENASVEFDVNTLRPTYRLLIGVPGKSNAFEISRRLGLPEYIIKDAKENVSKETLEFESLIDSLQQKNVLAEKSSREAKVLKEEAKKLKEKYEEKASRVTEVRDKAIYEAQREAKNIIKSAKAEADEILKNIRKLETMGYTSEMRQKLEEERKKLKNKLDSAESAMMNKVKEEGNALETVEEGQEVLLTTLNQKVIVLSKPNNRGEVLVQAGIMKITAKLENLRNAKGVSSSSKDRKASKRESSLRMASVSSSLDLRGMDAEEAIYTTDKYLDDAYLSGLGEVSIIHGKGTGVLRKAISDMLRTHSHVKNQRLGTFSEGGDGVTIVELK